MVTATRRRVLLGGAAPRALGSPAPVRSSWGLQPPDALGVFPVDGLTAGVAEATDAQVGDMLEPLKGAGVRCVLRTLEWGSSASRGRRFSQLPLAERNEVL